MVLGPRLACRFGVSCWNEGQTKPRWALTRFLPGVSFCADLAARNWKLSVLKRLHDRPHAKPQSDIALLPPAPDTKR